MSLNILDVPGAWYGNSPGSIPSRPDFGNVVIDPRQAVQALDFLRRRRAAVVATAVHDPAAENPGLYIAFNKPQRRPRA